MKKNPIKKIKEGTTSLMKGVFNGGKRLIFGEKGRDLEEKITTPSRIVVKNFFRKKGAVVALVCLCVLFIFVFFAPFFIKMIMSMYTIKMSI